MRGHVREASVDSISELTEDAGMLLQAIDPGVRRALHIAPTQADGIGVVVACGERLGTVTALDTAANQLLTAWAAAVLGEGGSQ